MNDLIEHPQPSSRLARRIKAARSLADDLAGQGQPRMAQVIRDLCNSAAATAHNNSQYHSALKTKGN